MTQMIKLRRIFIGITLTIIIGLLFQIDYTDLSFNVNKFPYISIISGLCAVLALFLSNRNEERN